MTRPHGSTTAVRLVGDHTALDGDLTLVDRPIGVVAFAHGSGSSRHSPRNRHVAEQLNDQGLATLLVDLLTADEEQVDVVTRHLRFDVDLLTRRLAGVVDELGGHPDTRGLPIGLFGASTGAAAALATAAMRPLEVGAVVSRGGRPDLARRVLGDVLAPTLLLVGERDGQVLELNRAARALLRAPSALRVIPGAGHLFEEPGALDDVAAQAAEWFAANLVRKPA